MLLFDVSAPNTTIGNRQGRRNVKFLECFHSAITYWLALLLLKLSITISISRFQSISWKFFACTNMQEISLIHTPTWMKVLSVPTGAHTLIYMNMNTMRANHDQGAGIHGFIAYLNKYDCRKVTSFSFLSILNVTLTTWRYKSEGSGCKVFNDSIHNNQHCAAKHYHDELYWWR